eukprot:TRINITY_DN44077_c0_g1_i2.p1 TRINITY_DN44077_c0_g1~~TRINITY_DN44077_c0_g1_i2.p1  ORF type:complete len:240 (+),score=38.64 TRINITY_DN44077_c0_g1_i2:145-864(+)
MVLESLPRMEADQDARRKPLQLPPLTPMTWRRTISDTTHDNTKMSKAADMPFVPRRPAGAAGPRHRPSSRPVDSESSDAEPLKVNKDEIDIPRKVRQVKSDPEEATSAVSMHCRSEQRPASEDRRRHRHDMSALPGAGEPLKAHKDVPLLDCLPPLQEAPYTGSTARTQQADRCTFGLSRVDAIDDLTPYLARFMDSVGKARDTDSKETPALCHTISTTAAKLQLAVGSLDLDFDDFDN